MKGIKGRLLKRFRSIPSIYTSKQHVVPICNDSQVKFGDQSPQNSPNHMQQEPRTISSLDLRGQDLEPRSWLERRNNGHNLSVDFAPAQEMDIFEECECDSMPEMETSSSTSSSPTSNHCEINDEGVHRDFEVLAEMPKDDSEDEFEFEFEEKCPPGGKDKVILYTTSLRGIRKTYEDCNAIKFLLESFRVVYFERDVSMDLKFRDELWEILGGRIIPPRLFIKGRHIGGADEVVTLHELGMLKKLLQGVPVVASTSYVKCSCCGGVRFFLCPDCHGSCKIYKGDEENLGNLFVRCSKCNENGLVKCSICS